jgi:hypothetical protein
VASVNPSGQQVILTELEDAQGAFTLTPAPSNAFDSRIDSVVMLAAAPATAPIRLPLTDSATTSAAVPVETLEVDYRTVQVLATEAAIPSVTAAAEASEVGVPAGATAAADAAPVHVSAIVHGAALVAVTSASTLAAVPLTGLAFQVAGISVVSAPALPSIAAGQHLADQFFQALVRTSNNPNDPTLGTTVMNALERMLPSQLLRLPADNLESLNWEEAGSGLDWQAPTDAAMQVGRHTRRDVARHESSAPATVSQANGERAALDQYFAQTADDTDPMMDDE